MDTAKPGSTPEQRAPKRVLRRAKRLVVALILVLVFSPILFCAGFVCWWKWETRWRDQTRDWPGFYRSQVSQAWKLPTDAQIVEAVEREGLMDYNYHLRFRLPVGSKPEDNLKRIAAGFMSPLDMRPSNALVYEGGDGYPGYTLTYDPKSGLYEITGGWFD